MVRLDGKEPFDVCGRACEFMKEELQHERKLEAFSGTMTELGYAHISVSNFRYA
jgi:hypothetical protein